MHHMYLADMHMIQKPVDGYLDIIQVDHQIGGVAINYEFIEYKWCPSKQGRNANSGLPSSELT